jgi:hypothetical protein
VAEIFKASRGQTDISAKILFWIALFAIAMGYLESAVVVYIRAIYYPEGFAFPLKLMSDTILVTEFFREVATLVMLAGIGIIAGRSRIERFGLFIYAFGWWDIFYYVFLKLLIDWPESLLTWDILFLIPTTWVGPVLAPCINAFSMIILGGMISKFQGKSNKAGLRAREWALLIVGSLVLLVVYMLDYSRYMLGEFSVRQLFFSLPDEAMLGYATKYVPVYFSWIIFTLGQGLILLGIIFYYFRVKKKKSRW